MFMRMELSQFIDAFEGRNDWDDTYTGHFSVAGLTTLYDHLIAAIEQTKNEENIIHIPYDPEKQTGFIVKHF